MKQLADILPGVVEFRHRLHRIPELAGEEFETSRLIRERSSSLPCSGAMWWLCCAVRSRAAT